jgi:dynein heavy chain, axonemal
MSLCLWVRAVSDFTDIYKEISSKKQYVAEMDDELQKANKLLEEKN